MTHSDIIHMFKMMLIELRQAEELVVSASAIDHLNNIRTMIYRKAEELRINMDELITKESV